MKETETIIPAGTKFYRARVSDKKGYSRKEMWAPPDDVASPGRANSKGQSCLYLCSHKKTTVKEIRAHAFDYITIATFKLNRNVRVLDLSSIVHSSPFYTENDKVAYLVNESTLRQIQNDMAKPMSRLDSELDYLPTQYISDFAKFLGYDGVKYFSTFEKTSYNVALFDAFAFVWVMENINEVYYGKPSSDAQWIFKIRVSEYDGRRCFFYGCISERSIRR